MAQPFDPAAHPALVKLGGRLRELAGDNAYQAGRDYLRKGLVKQGAVAGTTAYATVTGSTDYRVTVAFAADVKPTCTCPAHRRNKFCKHVVALCTALLERPAEFAAVDPVPDVGSPQSGIGGRGSGIRGPRGLPSPVRGRGAGGEGSAVGSHAQDGEHQGPETTDQGPETTNHGPGTRDRRPGTRAAAAVAQKAELRVAGLETVDRLLAELAGGGIGSLGPDKVALLASAGELVRALKLRRLGNLVLALQRAATKKRDEEVAPARFAGLLMDVAITRRAAGASLAGQIALDPRLAEDLLGKTWREEELEPTTGLELVELAFTRLDDGEFQIETAYLADLPTGAIYAEKQITPLRLRQDPKPRHRQRLLVDSARLYPGLAPRRIKLVQTRRMPLVAADVDRLLAHAPTALPELRRRLVERLQVPFGSAEAAVTFRPAALVTRDDLVGALDGDGRFLPLDWPAGWSDELPQILPDPPNFALFGLLTLGDRGLRLHCLSVVSSALRWSRGPVYSE